MKIVLTLSFMFMVCSSFASSASEIILGCEGEGCSCFQEYRASKTNGLPGENEIKTIRPFALYKDGSKNSKLVGKFEAGIKARPLKQELLVEDKGEYLVEAIRGSKAGLKKGDKIDTLISLGEGFLKGSDRGIHSRSSF